MKKIILSILLLCVFSNPIHAQQVDPALTSAIFAQTEMLKKLFKDREKRQNEIIAAEGLITVALTRLHDVEDKILGYLSNAQGAVQNLYQIKRAGQLMVYEIPKNTLKLKNAVAHNAKGTAIALLVSDRITDTYLEMASLYPFMKQLVTNGSYETTSGTDENGNPITEKHKVNLLNAAERYYIANTIVSKLESINTNLWLLAWQIENYTWNDLWWNLDPQGWAAVMTGKAHIESLVREWNRL